MNRYMTQYYDDDDDDNNTDETDIIAQCKPKKEIFFYTPIAVPRTSLSLHVWSVKVTGLLAPRVFYFTIYENGIIIDPSVDARFSRAYTVFFANNPRRNRPWVECYFTRLNEITLFLRLCTFFPSSSSSSPPMEEEEKELVPPIKASENNEKPSIITRLVTSLNDTLKDLFSVSVP